eukprot:GHVN01048988.1.p1 GENE.GHVN01048988.1~~GHVN01048988.1.p1  ORF type:complete len:101 (+),score=6.47 GHVN01048988.1:30-332(+)
MEQPTLDALEFFSGLGGMRLAAAKVPRLARIFSYDINLLANETYHANFGDHPSKRSIENLSLKEVDGVANLWLMSPPCQPYTRETQRTAATLARNRSISY